MSYLNVPSYMNDLNMTNLQPEGERKVGVFKQMNNITYGSILLIKSD